MMPAIPNSFFITKQVKQYVENKTIEDFVFCDFNRGKYNLFDISEEKKAPFKGGKIISADSNFIVTDGGRLCEFGYADGGLRTVYENTVSLVGEYLTGRRICYHTDIFGRQCGEDDETLTLFTSRNLGNPCPKCGSPIEFVAGGGTKLYYCPKCQPK